MAELRQQWRGLAPDIVHAAVASGWCLLALRAAAVQGIPTHTLDHAQVHPSSAKVGVAPMRPLMTEERTTERTAELATELNRRLNGVMAAHLQDRVSHCREQFLRQFG